MTHYLRAHALDVLEERAKSLRADAAADELQARRSMERAVGFWQSSEARLAQAGAIERDMRVLAEQLFPLRQVPEAGCDMAAEPSAIQRTPAELAAMDAEVAFNATRDVGRGVPRS